MDKKLAFLLRSIKDDIFGTGGVKSYAQQLESLPTDLKNGESLYIWNKARLPDTQREINRKLGYIAKNLDEYIATLQKIHGAELDMFKTTVPVISADSLAVEPSTTNSAVSGGPAIRFRKRGPVDPGSRTTNRFGAANPAPSRNAAVTPSGGAVGGRNRSNSRSNSPINWDDHELTMGEFALGGHFGDVAEGVALSSIGKHTGGAHRRRRTHKVRARKQRKSCKSRSH